MFRNPFYFRCPACENGKIPSNNIMPLCENCFDKLKVATQFCVKCGYPIDDVGYACKRCTTGIGKSVKNIYSTYKYNEVISKLMISIKFDYNITHALCLEKIIYLPKIDFSIYDIIIPMPSHISRSFIRFFHPTDIIANYISEVYDIKVDYALTRNRNTAFQSFMSNEERVKNVAGAFSYDTVATYKRILLVDDIITTGSSVDECSRVLKKNGANRIDCYALAHS